jgi:hypothetical protein
MRFSNQPTTYHASTSIRIGDRLGFSPSERQVGTARLRRGTDAVGRGADGGVGGAPAAMKVIYKLTLRNGNIYIGKDLIGAEVVRRAFSTHRKRGACICTNDVVLRTDAVDPSVIWRRLVGAAPAVSGSTPGGSASTW